MFTIALEDVEFYAYHGYYPEEHILGNRYLIDVHVELIEQPYFREDLSTTLNYETLYKILQTIMSKKYRLLESIAEDIHSEILRLSRDIYSIDVRIKKMNTPIPGMKGNSVIRLKKNYHA